MSSIPALYGDIISNHLIPCYWLSFEVGIKVDRRDLSVVKGEHKQVKKKIQIFFSPLKAGISCSQSFGRSSSIER